MRVVKILVTGANGFLGRRMCEILDSQGIPYIPFVEKIEDWKSQAINKYDNTNITHVVHLAAKSFVPESWNTPDDYICSNIESTVNVLQFCKKNNAALIFLSSYMYGFPKYLPIDERHETDVVNPYALSKYLSEKTCLFYAHNYHVPVSILRVFNIYGPGQKAHFLIPHIIGQVLSDPEIKVKDRRPKRDYIYIDDLVSAIITLFKATSQVEIFNIGSGVSCSVNEIISMIQEISGTNKPVQSRDEERPNEIMDVRADIRKVQDICGWSPVVSIRDGLKKCITEASES